MRRLAGAGSGGEERLQRAEVLLRERLGRRHQRGLMSRLDRAQHREDARPPSCRCPPPPSAVSASAVRRRDPRRSPRWPAAGRRSARTAARPASLRHAHRARGAGPRGHPRHGGRAGRPAPPGRERAPRRRGAPAPPRRRARPQGSARRPARPGHPPAAAPGAGDRESARPRAAPAGSPARSTRECAAGAGARSPGERERFRWCGGPPPIESRNSCSAMLRPRFSSLPCRKSRVPGLQPIREPGAVEPDGLHLAAGIAHVRLEDRQPAAAGGPHLRPDHLDLDGRLLPEPQIGQAHRLGAVAIAVRQMAEQVAEARDPHLLGGAPRAWARRRAAW